MDKQTIKTYDKLAEEYDAETINFWERFPDTIISTFAASIGEGGSVLDLGSGPGRDGLLLQNKGLSITCLDASSTMVKLCQEKGLTAVQGDILNIPFADDTFDGLWSYTSLLHLKKAQMGEALSEIKRVLKPGGTWGLGMIAGEGELYRESAGVGQPRWFAFYSEQELMELFETHGFKVLYFEDFTPKSKRYLNYVLRAPAESYTS
jgi:SAM-dependent methyltransferase